jgi:hypothetical protein
MGNSTRFGRQTWIVVSLLLISLILRWILIFRGGQYYISDETRYEVSRNAARFLLQGQLGEAFKQFTLSPEHLGFQVAGILPAILENVTRPSLVLPAMFFSLFSVFNLYLIFLLSRRTTAFPAAPLWALILSASCVSLLYFSRHLFPYDLAMSFGLLALFSGLSKHQTARTSLVCGGLSLLCFITYNGYWLLAGFAMLVNVLMQDEISIPIVWKAICTAIGFLAPLALLVAAMSGSGTDMIQEYRSFATSITQGSFEEGGSLPFAYFWHTEHVVILILAVLSILAAISSFRYRRKQTGCGWEGFSSSLWAC